MSSVARGKSAPLLAVMLLAFLLLGAGCAGTKGVEDSPPGLPAAPVQTLPSTVPPLKTLDLSSPPPKATPHAPSGDPIIGIWYAPPPDDLTFEFFADGTFTERSPNFRTYYGTWAVSEEGEERFYDAAVLDQWGYKKQVHILITSGTLYIKSMGTLHRVG